MSSGWLCLVVALWLVVVLLVVVVLGLGRRITQLEARAPAAGIETFPGPAVGGYLPASVPRDTLARQWELFLFLSSTCSACDRLVERLCHIGGLDLPQDVGFSVVTKVAKPGQFDGLGASRILSGDYWSLIRSLGIPATPYALVVSREGLILESGAVNSPEMLAAIVELTRAASLRSELVGPAKGAW